ncbi:MAG: NAD(P)/FAD-dependent oxidoreductase [Dehalococcoidia bacterium]|jgi:phytoene dehydrogenase-like protein
MAEKSVIIIGAGIAGLCAGCYTRMNGYRTQMFEMHDKPGGLCTAWERKGYTFDLCIDWLMGSKPGVGIYPLWQELGALPGQEIINMERFYRVETVDGGVVEMYNDIDRLEAHLLEIAPEDEKTIKEVARAIRRFTKLDMSVEKPPELSNFFDGIKMMFKMLPFMGDFRKWGKMTMDEFVQRFKNPRLRSAWKIMPPEMSGTAMVITMAGFDQKSQGYPIGGSLPFARAIEKRYLSLGGEAHYKSKVTKILVENDCAVGIELADGSQHRADYVISAADGYTTIFEMLEGKYVDDTVRGYYKELPIFEPLVFMGLGVNRDFADFPQMVTGLILQLEKPITVGGKERRWLEVRIHNFDPTLAPKGKTTITVMFDSNYAYWEKLHKDLKAYKAEKAEIARLVIEALDRRFPGLAAQVEVTDVSTPVTFKRYTGNWQGSFEGWMITPKTMMLRMKKTLPGLDAFYMIGQWIQPGGGLPTGAITGRHVAQILCKRDKKEFVTTVP